MAGGGRGWRPAACSGPPTAAPRQAQTCTEEIGRGLLLRLKRIDTPPDLIPPASVGGNLDYDNTCANVEAKNYNQKTCPCHILIVYSLYRSTVPDILNMWILSPILTFYTFLESSDLSKAQ